MKLAEIKKLPDDVIELIDQITDLHPSYGVNLRLAHYTGGFVDAGHWIVSELAKLTVEQLRQIIDTITYALVHRTDDPSISDRESFVDVGLADRFREAIKFPIIYFEFNEDGTIKE